MRELWLRTDGAVVFGAQYDRVCPVVSVTFSLTYLLSPGNLEAGVMEAGKKKKKKDSRADVNSVVQTELLSSPTSSAPQIPGSSHVIYFMCKA